METEKITSIGGINIVRQPLLSFKVKNKNEEYTEYEKRGLLNLLRFLVYLVDTMRENNIVWGVGRGSSVASYVLYLIGIHKINSIQYGLDWHEFMR